MLSAIYGRICERLEATGLGAREAARLAGLNPDAIRNIRRGVEDQQSGRVGVSTRTIAALAPVLGVTSAWLLEGSTEVESGALPFVDWADVGLYLDPAKAFDAAGQLGEQFGSWPAGYFATQAPDDAMNRVAPRLLHHRRSQRPEAHRGALLPGGPRRTSAVSQVGGRARPPGAVIKRPDVQDGIHDREAAMGSHRARQADNSRALRGWATEG